MIIPLVFGIASFEAEFLAKAVTAVPLAWHNRTYLATSA